MPAVTAAESRAAVRDLEIKLRLERTFAPEIKSLFAQMASDFRVQVAVTGTVADASEYVPSWKALLGSHYRRTHAAFAGLVEGQVAPEEMTPVQRDEAITSIEVALLNWRKLKAAEAAQEITQTNAADMADSVADARLMLSDSGQPVDNRSLAQQSTVNLKRRFAARVATIATTETQAAAEVSKIFEALAMSGMPPTLNPQVLQGAGAPVKKWVTVGDERVRESHRRANGQKRRVVDAFEVGGSPMLYPGDGSRGAGIGLLINCRCSAVYYREGR